MNTCSDCRQNPRGLVCLVLSFSESNDLINEEDNLTDLQHFRLFPSQNGDVIE